MTNKQANEYYSLQEIANWQTNPSDSEVVLPKLQRGFVWKSKQIEDLWDSILRGYPIGSFLFSSTGKKFFLMDGQQRATSIFLGFNNPYTQNSSIEAWSIKGELPIVWLDIAPKEKPSSSKFFFRLTTKSHPWGYQAKNNQSRLSISNRRKALAVFQQHPNNKETNYTKFSNITTFPFESAYPIPLAFLIESETVEDVITKVEHLPDYINTLRGDFENKEEFIYALRNTVCKELKDILSEVKQLNDVKIKYNTIDHRVLNEENDTDGSDPTLFVRINSSGTALSGDDLIYSIYKSIYPEAKDLIEQIAADFIKPTKVLSLVTRMVASDIEESTFVKKMNVRGFQRRIKDEAFKTKLGQMIKDHTFENLFKVAIEILSCKKNPLFEGELPPVLIKQAINTQQELFLFVLYWLHIHKIKLTNETKFKIAAKFFTFAFFNFANEKRLWKESIKSPDFWDSSINNLMWWDGVDGIHFLVKPDLLYQYYSQSVICEMFKNQEEHRWSLWKNGTGNIINYYNKIKSQGQGQAFADESTNQFFWKFIHVLRSNRQLILFAQRQYLNETFGDYNQMDDLEDTNVPWDWDHIYPSEWVYRKKNCNKGIREWNNTNGNYRAISLEDNRSRGNRQAPSALNDPNERQNSFILDNDWENWKKIEARILDEEINNHFGAITKRMINIYAKFWQDFKIMDLIDENNTTPKNNNT